VLVVEDQEVNQKVAVRQLALLGVLADIASDGEQGLAQWRNETYALVFTDLHMPRMDGYAMVKALRAEEAALDRPRTPVLALTANALRGEERRAREVGMDEYLTKPIPLEALHGALQRWLPATTKSAAPANCPPATSTPEPHHVGTVEPTLDTDVLRRLVGDDPEVLNEFMEDFRTALGTLTAELREAFRTSDLSQVGAVAHKLKSAAKSVGALPLANLCERLCLVPGNLASSQQDDLLLQRERVDFERLVEALEVALQGLREGASS
jgi:CheY-like chemotaxis protein